LNITTEGTAGTPILMTHGASWQRRFIAALFVISFALDFKGAMGGSSVQYAMASVNTAAFLLLAISYRAAFPRSIFAAVLFWGWIIFLAVGSIAAMINTVPFNQFIRTIYPFVLFLEGFLVCWWVSRDPRGAKALVSAMIFSAIVSMVFTVWWGFHFSGEAYGNIRYQILSPLLPFLIVTCLFDLFFYRRRRFKAIAVLVLALGIVAVSVTRGMLLVLALVAVAVSLAWLWNIFKNRISLPRPMGQMLFGVLAVGICGLVIIVFLAPDVMGRWVYRGLGASHSVTFWTRAAAVVGQWDLLTLHGLHWVFGWGFGHSYHWAQAFAQIVYPHISPAAFNAPRWFPGEFMWVTPWFYAGFVGGSLAIAAWLWGAVRSMRLLMELLRSKTWRLATVRPAWLGALGYFAFLGLGFTANPFILRLSALFLGMCLALIVTAHDSMMPFCLRSDDESHESPPTMAT
jgi:hypothetical protein